METTIFNLKADKIAADIKERDNLPALNPHLQVNTQKDAKTTKANLAADLKKSFPGVKFSIKKDNYSTYYVSWKNGPTTEQVSKINNKYEDHESSYCGDYRDYNPSNFNRVFGGFKYIFENREISEDIKELANELPARDSADRWGNLNIMHRIISKTEIPQNYTAAKLERTEVTIGSPEDFYKLVFTIEEKPEKKETKTEGLQLVDYSEKCIVVIGNTYPLKNQLRQAGGKFNKFLKCGPGWIFAKEQEIEIKTIFNF